MRGPRNIFRVLTAGLISGLLFSITTGVVVSAATPDDPRESVTLSPTNKHYKFDAGQSKKDYITVINDGSVDYSLRVYAEPYSVKNEAYEPDFFTKKKNTDIETWIIFATNTYTIRAGQSLEIPYTIAVPSDAAPGGHYGVLFAETQPVGGANGTSVERKKRVGTLMYATVNGQYQLEGNFKGIRTPSLQFVPPLKSELDVQNTGNTDFAVETVFAVSDIFGNRKFTSEREYQMLPQTTRKVVLQWDKSPGFGVYQVITSAKFLDKTITNTTYVLMAPLMYYMVFVVGLLVAVIFYVQKRR